jgi:hypothetical protein
LHEGRTTEAKCLRQHLCRLHDIFVALKQRAYKLSAAAGAMSSSDPLLADVDESFIHAEMPSLPKTMADVAEYSDKYRTKKHSTPIADLRFQVLTNLTGRELYLKPVRET